MVSAFKIEPHPRLRPGYRRLHEKERGNMPKWEMIKFYAGLAFWTALFVVGIAVVLLGHSPRPY